MEAPESRSKTQTGSVKKRVKGAEAVILSLLEEGVNQIFGYPGGSIMPVYDSLMNYEKSLNHLLVRHEQGAVHAAQGYARASGETGVVMATSGPGATNLMTGISDANIDSTPLVCITGQVPDTLLGTDGFQEVDIIGISAPVTKWNFQITKPEEIPGAIAKAFYIARSGRPGPVLIDLTKNAQFGELDFHYEKCNEIRSYKPVPDIEMDQIEQAAELIDNSEKPMALIGQGVILGEAEKELKDFLDKTGIPAASTLLGLSAIPNDYPNYVGYLGMHGNYAPNVLTNEADLLISIGMRFDDRVTGKLSSYGENARVIHMDIDPAEIDKNVKADVPILGDVKETLPYLTEQVKENAFPEWIRQFREYEQEEYDKILKEHYDKYHKHIRMTDVILELNEKGKEPLLVTDVGQHQMIACRYFHFTHPRSLITSGGLGTMGFGLPAALGAQIGTPNRQVVAVVGDGGFQMTMQELGTIAQSNIPLKIIILNNSYLGMVRQWQQLFFKKRYASTPITSPNYMKIAEGYGLNASRITQLSEVPEALDAMFATEGPYLLEVVVEKEDNVFPMIAPGTSVSDIMLGPSKESENENES
ncbi:MAG: biosynthetic-type acetolactate synthase large subunit [Bacteroidales bacterium]